MTDQMNAQMNAQSSTPTLYVAFDAHHIQEIARKLVVECLHYSGKLSKYMTQSIDAKARVACNGFGDLNRNQFKSDEDYLDVLYDWSHVRDSDDFHIRQVAYDLLDYISMFNVSLVSLSEMATTENLVEVIEEIWAKNN